MAKYNFKLLLLDETHYIDLLIQLHILVF